MKYLYAPWRGSYLTEDNPLAKAKKRHKCIFCEQFKKIEDDEQNFVLKRFNHALIMLNLYPYNPGHVLIIPYEHVSDLDKLTKETRQEIMELMSFAIPLIKESLNNTGTNVGINLGSKAAGGSIPEHIHVHILPRWEGDTNFLPALAQTKQLSTDLKEVYKKLKTSFENFIIF